MKMELIGNVIHLICINGMDELYEPNPTKNY